MRANGAKPLLMGLNISKYLQDFLFSLTPQSSKPIMIFKKFE